MPRSAGETKKKKKKSGPFFWHSKKQSPSRILKPDSEVFGVEIRTGSQYHSDSRFMRIWFG
jgi:hypothetical protein